MPRFEAPKLVFGGLGGRRAGWGRGQDRASRVLGRRGRAASRVDGRGRTRGSRQQREGTRSGVLAPAVRFFAVRAAARDSRERHGGHGRGDVALGGGQRARRPGRGRCGRVDKCSGVRPIARAVAAKKMRPRDRRCPTFASRAVTLSLLVPYGGDRRGGGVDRAGARRAGLVRCHRARCRPAAGLGMALAAVAVQARTLVNHERRAHHRRL